MVDMVQSYNMMDSMDYAKPQQTQNRIDRELLEMEFMNKELPPVYC